jgi:NAD+-processing family protein with receiver domain
VRVWLDDEREAPAGWMRTRTPAETIGLLRTGQVRELSLDHDLGLASEESEQTGYDVLVWLEREVAEGRWRSPLPAIRVHSANPVGRARMERAIAAIERLGEPTGRG